MKTENITEPAKQTSALGRGLVHGAKRRVTLIGRHARNTESISCGRAAGYDRERLELAGTVTVAQRPISASASFVLRGYQPTAKQRILERDRELRRRASNTKRRRDPDPWASSAGPLTVPSASLTIRSRELFFVKRRPSSDRSGWNIRRKPLESNGTVF